MEYGLGVSKEELPEEVTFRQARNGRGRIGVERVGVDHDSSKKEQLGVF